jgi:hypothetical protein
LTWLTRYRIKLVRQLISDPGDEITLLDTVLAGLLGHHDGYCAIQACRASAHGQRRAPGR